MLKAGQVYLDNMGGVLVGNLPIYLQGVSSDHSPLYHLFLVNYVEMEIIKEAISIMLPKQHSLHANSLACVQTQQKASVAAETHLKTANTIRDMIKKSQSHQNKNKD